MKNILILTKIYPGKDLPSNDTKVVHYFAKEWKKMGYNVLVIHNLVLFPPFVYWITRMFSSKLAAIFGAVVPTVNDAKIKEYEVEGVDVIRIPIRKYIPHGMFSGKAIVRHYEKVKSILKSKKFVPDLIIGHWWNPQLQLLEHFKEDLNVKTCLTVHDFNSIQNVEVYKQLFKSVDVFGMRSNPITGTFKHKFGDHYKTFFCASGVPEQFIVGNNHRDFSKPIENFCYVGTMIKRKFPFSLLQALELIHDDLGNFRVDYVGAGAELKHIENYLEKKTWKDNVMIHGAIPRMQVSTVLKTSDCFVMISKNEAFGLVYLEAMGCGCIPIASRNEGMDGIIIDGENGFLCESGNYEELSRILIKMNRLTEPERRRISDNAVKTAAYYTDFLAAKRYIDNVINL